MLNFPSSSVEQPTKIGMAKITFEVLVAMREPVIFAKAGHVFRALSDGAKGLVKAAKEQAAEKKKPMNRVTSGLNQQQTIAFKDATASIFKIDDAVLEKQFLMSSLLPSDLDAQMPVSTAFAPSFFAYPPLHETTNYEGHMFGSLRINLAGADTLFLKSIVHIYIYIYIYCGFCKPPYKEFRQRAGN